MSAAAPTCTTAEVALRIPERVSDATGDFSAGTYPTATQVTTLIGEVIQEVQATVGTTVDSSLASLATMCVAYGAAAEVELGFFSNQAPDNQSKYEWLRARFESLLEKLAAAQQRIDQGLTPGSSEVADPTVFVLPDSHQRSFEMTRLDERF